MDALETYRNAKAVHTTAEQQAQKTKDVIAANRLAEQKKAQKDFNLYMKHIQKKINKCSAKGEFSLRYCGTHRIFGGRWTNSLADLVVAELLKMGFNANYEVTYNYLYIYWNHPSGNT